MPAGLTVTTPSPVAVLLYLGDRGAHVDDRLHVLPLDRLWS